MLGAVTTFGCDSGLDLVGSRSSACQGDGMWSSPVPTCQQMGEKYITHTLYHDYLALFHLRPIPLQTMWIV